MHYTKHSPRGFELLVAPQGNPPTIGHKRKMAGYLQWEVHPHHSVLGACSLAKPAQKEPVSPALSSISHVSWGSGPSCCGRANENPAAVELMKMACGHSWALMQQGGSGLSHSRGKEPPSSPALPFPKGTCSVSFAFGLHPALWGWRQV